MKSKAVLALSLFSIGGAALAQEGLLDPSYGILSSGRVVYGHDVPANNHDSPAGLVVDAQGRAYTVGVASDVNTTVWRATLAKLTPAGILDTGFGGDGKVVSTDVEGSFLATDIGRDSLGQLIVAGSRVFGNLITGDRDFMVCRFNTAGTAIDFAAPTNNHCRVVSFDLGGTNIDQVTSLQMLPDGSMFLVGYAENTNDFSTARIAIVKLTSTGALDLSFSNDGKMEFNYPGGGQAYIYDTDVSADGSLYLGGYVDLAASRAVLAIKINSNGIFDTAFGGDGFQAYHLDLGAQGFRDDTAYAIALMPDNKLLIGGGAQEALGMDAGFLIRVSASGGGFDTGFGNAGRIILGGNGTVKDIAVQSGNRIFYSRERIQAGARRFLIGKFIDDLQDTNFGPGGTIDFGFGYAEANDVPGEIAISDGRVVVLGLVKKSAADGEFGVARLRGDAMFADRFE